MNIIDKGIYQLDRLRSLFSSGRNGMRASEATDLLKRQRRGKINQNTLDQAIELGLVGRTNADRIATASDNLTPKQSTLEEES